MKIEIKRNLKIEDTYQIRSVVPDIMNGIWENEFMKILGTNSGVGRYIELSNGNGVKELFECSISSYINCLWNKKLIMQDRNKMKVQDYKSKMTELENRINKLGMQKASLGFTAVSYVRIDKDYVYVGFNGARLLLLSNYVSMETIDCIGKFNLFNVDLSAMKDEDRVTTNVMKFNRIINYTSDEVTVVNYMARPVRMAALSSFVSNFVQASTSLELNESVIAAYDVVGRLEKYGKHFNVETIEKEDVEFVPRSLEELFYSSGYEGTMPFHEGVCGYRSVLQGKNQRQAAVTSVEFICSTLGGLYKPEEVILLPMYVNKTIGNIENGQLALAKMRRIVQFITYLWFGDISRKEGVIDLGVIVDKYYGY